MKLLINILTIFGILMSTNFPVKAVKFNLIADPIRPIRTIVLDAGHGGHDPGCHGKSHKEKDLTLQMTLKLGKMLAEQYSDLNILYTRTTDKFIPLHERIGFANKSKADLFISIHCNYVKNKNTKGTETFVMGLHRADDNLEVAMRENQSILLEKDVKENYNGFDPNSPVGYIMLTSYQDAYLSQSIAIASKVENNLKKRNFTPSRGVKQAGFAVLREATMPSMLVEAGFLSNPEEELYLGSNEGQLQFCQSIVASLEGIIGVSKPMDTDQMVASIENTVNVTPKSNAPRKEVNLKVENPAIEEKKQSMSKPTTPTYRIQVAAVRQENTAFSDNLLADIGELNVVYENNLYKYQVGNFTSNEHARQAKQKLIDRGFKEAFLVISK